MVPGPSRHADPKTLMKYDDSRRDDAGTLAQMLGNDSKWSAPAPRVVGYPRGYVPPGRSSGFRSLAQKGLAPPAQKQDGGMTAGPLRKPQILGCSGATGLTHLAPKRRTVSEGWAH